MSTLAISSLVGGKLKLFSGIALAGISATAIPIAWITGNTGNNDITGQIGNAISSASESIDSHISGMSSSLKGEYESMGNNTVETFTTQNSINNVTNQWKEGEEVAKGAYGYLSENIQDINYYAFVLGNVIKAAIAMIPTSIRDTIVYSEETKADQQLLSVQKTAAIVQMKHFSEFAEAILQLVKQHHKLLEGLTMADGKGLMKIFREIREDDFDRFMKKVKDNIGGIKKDKTYSTATDLLKDVFIGADEIGKFSNYVKQLQEKINILKESLKAIEGVGEEKINELQKILETLSKSDIGKTSDAPK